MSFGTFLATKGSPLAMLRQLAVILGDALFIHGGLYDDALGAETCIVTLLLEAEGCFLAWGGRNGM